MQSIRFFRTFGRSASVNDELSCTAASRASDQFHLMRQNEQQQQRRRLSRQGSRNFGRASSAVTATATAVAADHDEIMTVLSNASTVKAGHCTPEKSHRKSASWTSTHQSNNTHGTKQPQKLPSKVMTNTTKRGLLLPWEQRSSSWSSSSRETLSQAALKLERQEYAMAESVVRNRGGRGPPPSSSSSSMPIKRKESLSLPMKRFLCEPVVTVHDNNNNTTRRTTTSRYTMAEI